MHETVEGWIESVALADHAAMWAQQITKVSGDAADALDLGVFEPVAEVRGPDSLVAVYTAEAVCLNAERIRTAHIYSGLDRWGLRGGV